MRIDDELSIIITLNVSECTDGVYLRWINRLGEYCYYLFTKNADMKEIKDSGANIVNYLEDYDWANNYHSGTNHPSAKTVQKSQRLFAPMVDRDTFKFLESLMESTYIDMLAGYDDANLPNWVTVNVSQTNITKDKFPMQDFELILILPATFVQNL